MCSGSTVVHSVACICLVAMRYISYPAVIQGLLLEQIIALALCCSSACLSSMSKLAERRLLRRLAGSGKSISVRGVPDAAAFPTALAAFGEAVESRLRPTAGFAKANAGASGWCVRACCATGSLHGQCLVRVKSAEVDVCASGKQRLMHFSIHAVGR